ncbi:MAG: hypothetical protein HY929_02355 [Euryarchaeota archaeon]|nr:hypothetical protein [Euryarchaeota archaeon]
MSFRLTAEIQKMLEKLSKEESKDKSELVRELLTLDIKEKKLRKTIQLYKEESNSLEGSKVS